MQESCQENITEAFIFRKRVDKEKKGSILLKMATKYIYEEYEDYIWCKKYRVFPNDCEDDESTWIWANWAGWLPGHPYVDRHPCMVDTTPCYPWQIDEIIYDAGGKWKVIGRGTETWQLAQFNMYDCYWSEPSQAYWKYFHLDYLWVAWALLEHISDPAKNAPSSVVEGLSLLGLVDRTPYLVEGLGIGVGEREEG